MTEKQAKLTSDMDAERTQMVRCLRRIADRFSDEYAGPEARAIGRIYRAAGELIYSVNWADFADVAKANQPED